MRKSSYVLLAIFMVIFMGGIAWGLYSSSVATCYDNPNYSELQPESFIPDEIDKVLRDEELGQIYVCYNSANYVNVYSESGEFLWAVATPDIRNSYFALQDDKLIIYYDDAYVYNSKNGEFLGLKKAEDLDLSYDWEYEQTDEFIDGEFYFDSYQVYRADSNGNLHTVVSRPWWHWIYNFGVSWCIAFASAIGMGVIWFIEKRRSYNSVKKKFKFTNHKAKTVSNYIKITSIIQLAYTFLDVVFGFFGGILCIGIIPIAIHFAVSSFVLSNMLKKISVTQDEERVLDYWGVVELITFIAAFISVIIAAGIA